MSQCVSTVMLLLNVPILNSIGLVIFYIAVILTVVSGIDYLVKNKKVLNLDDI